MFKRETLLKAGGFRIDTVGEDMEIIVRLQRQIRKQNLPQRITYTSKAVCFTDTPRTLNEIFRQRTRWQMGLLEVIRLNARMLFNPKYGTIGVLALPYLLIKELLAPAIAIVGSLTVALLLAGNSISLAGLLLPLAAYTLFHELKTLLVYYLHSKQFNKPLTKRTALRCLRLGLIQLFLYNPFLTIAHLNALFRYDKLKGQWLK